MPATRVLALGLLGALLLLSGRPAGGDTRYEVVDLGDGTQGTAISKREGIVVGARLVDGQQLAFELYPVVRLLGVLPQGAVARPRGVSGARIVGESTTGFHGVFTHAFLFRTDTGTLTDLGTLGDEQLFSSASGVGGTEDVTDVIGTCERAGQIAVVPCRWLNGQTAVELATLGGVGGNATAINERRGVTGNSQTTDNATHCTYWPDEGGVFDCHPAGVAASFGVDINLQGIVVGNAFGPGDLFAPPTPSQTRRGFVAYPFGATQFLAPLAGLTQSQTGALNDRETVVGSSDESPGGVTPRATLWHLSDPDHPLDLNSQIEAPGWHLGHGIGLSNAGLILGVGTLAGEPRAFLLVPREAPAPHPPTSPPPRPGRRPR